MRDEARRGEARRDGRGEARRDGLGEMGEAGLALRGMGERDVIQEY